MRTSQRMGMALLVALALSTPVFAQSTEPRLSVNAALGPSFANLGTTFSTIGGVDYRLNERATLVGEVGLLPHAPFSKAADIAPAALEGRPATPHVNAYHWNGNLRIRPVQWGRFQPYVTAGLGAFAADIVERRVVGSRVADDRRRVTDFSTNVGGGILYRLNDWVGVTADYRTFFVHREADTPAVNRFTAGLKFSLQ